MPRKKKLTFVTDTKDNRKYEKLCENIFGVDPNVRFAAVYDKEYSKLAGGMRKGLVSYFTDEQREEAITHQFNSWKIFHILQKHVGEPQYSAVRFDRAILLSFFLDVSKLLFVSLEPIAQFDTNLKKIQGHIMRL